MQRRFYRGLLLAAIFSSGISLMAEVKTAPLFSSNMVLQRDCPVPVWGTADPGEAVELTFAGQSLSGKADDQGNWELRLAPLALNREGAVMTVKGAKNTLTLENILVGDVWLCGGQSNMEMDFTWGVLDSERFLKEAAQFPLLRHAKIQHGGSPLPLAEAPCTPWTVAGPETTQKWTACGYFFARKIFQETGIPIGIFEDNWSGSTIEAFIAPEGIQLVPELKADFAEFNYIFSNGKVPPPRKFTVQEYLQKYNAMIAPVVRFPVKGVIWYQGCSNGSAALEPYEYKMKALILGWRQIWKIDFPFYYVQLAALTASGSRVSDPVGGTGFSATREAQRRSLAIPKTGMACTIDIGMPSNIHPVNKFDVGERLARWALHNDYGKKEVVVSGPLYREMQVEGGAIRLKFDCAEGLMTARKKDLEAPVPTADPPKHFAISGADRVWYWADAKIDGKDVVVSSPQVPFPTAVRYAYRGYPQGVNLYNAAGLPMVPFTTEIHPVNTTLWQLLAEGQIGLISQQPAEVSWIQIEYGDARFLRYDHPECPLATDNPEIRLSVWQRGNGTFLAALSHQEKQYAPRKTMTVAPLHGNAPAIDGELNDPAWQEACELNNFRFLGEGYVEAPYQTTGYVTFDKDFLYIAASCKGADPRREVKVHDTQVWDDDSVEFYFCTDPATQEFRQIIFSASGAWYDGSKSEKAAFDFKAMRHAVKIGKEHWTVEAAIPWKELNAAPDDLQKGGQFRMNLCRNHREGAVGGATWSPAAKSYQDVSEFGLFTVGNRSDREPVVALTGPQTVKFKLQVKNGKLERLETPQCGTLSTKKSLDPNQPLELAPGAGMFLAGKIVNPEAK